MTISLARAALGGALFFVGLAATFGPPAAAADAVADFYKDRTVTVVFGAGVGGSYGLYSQLTTRHMGGKLPGTPNMVFQSMPGAGGMKALGYVYNAAAQDGSVIILAHQEVLQETILNDKAKFDARKFHWIGRYVDVAYIGVASGKSGVKTLEDARRREVVAGATGARAASALAPLAFNRVAGTKFKVVAGYKGTDEMFLAQERGEINLVTASWVVLKAFHSRKLESGKLVPIFAMALDRLKEYPNVPAITEFGRDKAEKAFLGMWAAGGMIGRSLAAPPGVPADRVEALRAAFLATVKDDDFRRDAAERNAALNTLPGAELAKKIDAVMELSPEEVAGTRRVYAELLKSAADQ